MRVALGRRWNPAAYLVATERRACRMDGRSLLRFSLARNCSALRAPLRRGAQAVAAKWDSRCSANVQGSLLVPRRSNACFRIARRSGLANPSGRGSGETGWRIHDATGIFNGSNVGAMITPLLVPLFAATWGWPAAFYLTGAVGLMWVAPWIILYRHPSQHPRVSEANSRTFSGSPQSIARSMETRVTRLERRV